MEDMAAVAMVVWVVAMVAPVLNQVVDLEVVRVGMVEKGVAMADMELEVAMAVKEEHTETRVGM